jgi:uncharacterized protein YjeT (DUF2065 family)/uncharacterized coiled-coil protein SlyX
MLPTITIIIGAFVILSRLPLLLFPEKGKELAGKVLSARPLVSVLGLVMVAAAILIGYAAARETYAMEFLLWIIGGLMFVFGLIYVVAPQTAKQLWDSLIAPRSLGMVRAFSGAGVVIGLFVLVLGLTWLGQQAEMEGMMPRRIALPEEPASRQIAILSDQLSQIEKQAAENSQKIGELRESLEQMLVKRVSKLEGTVTDHTRQVGELRGSLQEVVTERVSKLEGAVTEQSRQITDIRQVIDKVQQSLKGLQESFEIAPPKPKVSEP